MDKDDRSYTAVRPLSFDSSYGSLTGDYVIDDVGRRYALATSFERIGGAKRSVRYLVDVTDIDDDELIKERLRSIIHDEAKKTDRADP